MKKFLLFLCFLAYSNLALAKDDIQLKNAGNVKILRTTPQAEQILDLQFQSRELEVTSTLVEGEKKDSVVLNGKYDQPGGTLKVNKKQLKLAPDGSFKLKFRLKSPATDLVFTAVSKDGVEHNETISIAASGALASSTPKVFHTQVFNLGVGFSLISYSDRNYSSYTEKAITAKLSLGTQLTYSWSWGINAFVTAL
ncbi:MAG: hypothetical protein HY072_05150, partial [Deltaproteobacteria bacterium]|nr:hypothetical protein [Deltaproteobacteria bacterium]